MVSGIPNGYKLVKTGLAGDGTEFRFSGGQLVVVKVNCLSIPTQCKVETLITRRVKDWWNFWNVDSGYHWEDSTSDSISVAVGPIGVVYVDFGVFGKEPLSWHFKISEGSALFGKSGNASGLFGMEFWTNTY